MVAFDPHPFSTKRPKMHKTKSTVGSSLVLIRKFQTWKAPRLLQIDTCANTVPALDILERRMSLY